MNKYLFCLLMSVFVGVTGFSQDEKRLNERLDSALRLTEISDLDKLLDFTYPKLFTLVPREEMLSTLKSGLENEDFAGSVDSVKKVRVFPVFKHENAFYAKVIHTMRLNMKFKQDLDSTEADELLELMRIDFGAGNISFNHATNTVGIFMLVTMVAIKDEHSPEWSFITFDDDEEDHELGAMLFPAAVLEKLKTYQ
jgi:hypothetical protein